MMRTQGGRSGASEAAAAQRPAYSRRPHLLSSTMLPGVVFLAALGMVAPAWANAGGTLAPGTASPIGTLTIVGPLSFAAGSFYNVRITPTSNDRTDVTGTATIAGGTVNVTAAPGTYDPTRRFTILTATGGINGRFAALPPLIAILAFVRRELFYDSISVQLGFQRNTVSFPTVGITPNQRATGTAVQRLGSGNRIYDAVVTQTAAGARRAFDALSGEIHASAVSGAFEDSRLPREAILDRLTEPYGPTAPILPSNGLTASYSKDGPVLPTLAQPSVYTAWAQGFGDFGQIGGNGNAATVDRSLGGFAAGIDVSPDTRWRLGIATAYTQSWLTVPARGSSGSIETVSGGVYGGAALNNWRLRGGALIGSNDYDLSRSIAFPGFTDKARSKYGGATAQGFGEVGYHFGLGRSSLEPFVGGFAMHIDTDRFRETGGAAALIASRHGYDYQAATIGIRGDTALSMFGGLPLSAYGALAYQHVFGDVTPASLLAFASGPNNTFTATGAPVANNALVAEAGLDWRLTQSTTAGLFYSGLLASKTYDNAVKGELEVRF